MTIGGLLIAGVIICILIYIIASATGIIGGGAPNKNPGNTQEQEVDEKDLIEVPEILNMTEDEAKEAINALGLGVKRGGEEASDTVPVGQITRQDPEAGEKVEKNSQVIYYISTGKKEEAVTIPNDLVGEPSSDVETILQDLGLKVDLQTTKSEDVAVGDVISLNPGEGEKVEKGSTVVVEVSIGEGDKMVKVPNVRGIKEADALRTLQNLGLIAKAEYSDDPDAKVGYGEVFDQSIRSGKRVEAGTFITIMIRTEQEELPVEPETPDNETNDNESQTGNNQTGTGVWAALNQTIKQPDNYNGGKVQLRLVQDGDGDEKSGGTVVVKDAFLNFGAEGYSTKNIVGKTGVDTGVLFFEEMQDDGSYKTIWSYKLKFSEKTNNN